MFTKNKSDIFCPNCGDKMPSDTKFCTNCGFDLSEIKADVRNTINQDETVSTDFTGSSDKTIETDPAVRSKKSFRIGLVVMLVPVSVIVIIILSLVVLRPLFLENRVEKLTVNGDFEEAYELLLSMKDNEKMLPLYYELYDKWSDSIIADGDFNEVFETFDEKKHSNKVLLKIILADRMAYYWRNYSDEKVLYDPVIYFAVKDDSVLTDDDVTSGAEIKRNITHIITYLNDEDSNAELYYFQISSIKNDFGLYAKINGIVYSLTEKDPDIKKTDLTDMNIDLLAKTMESTYDAVFVDANDYINVEALGELFQDIDMTDLNFIR
jgi:hypothetical protein